MSVHYSWSNERNQCKIQNEGDHRRRNSYSSPNCKMLHHHCTNQWINELKIELCEQYVEKVFNGQKYNICFKSTKPKCVTSVVTPV